MLNDVKAFEGYAVLASDGEIGTVEDVYFDDARWVVRYVVVATGTWLSRRSVLLTPDAVRSVDRSQRVLHVVPSGQQVKDSPGTETDRPVSRQRGIATQERFGFPERWDVGKLWGLSVYPSPWVGASPDPLLASQRPCEEANAHRSQRHEDGSADPHLRSSNEVIGHQVMAIDGPIGSLANVVFEDEDWTIRHLVVGTRKWLPGRHVLVAPEGVDRIDWDAREVVLDMTRQAVDDRPYYDPSTRPRTRTSRHDRGVEPRPPEVVVPLKAPDPTPPTNAVVARSSASHCR